MYSSQFFIYLFVKHIYLFFLFVGNQLKTILLFHLKKTSVYKYPKWDVTDSLKPSIKTADIKATEFLSDQEAAVLCYEGYGSEKIKEAKIGPDCLLQMAYNLAYYSAVWQILSCIGG